MFRASDEAYEKPFVFGVGSQVEIPEFVFQPAPFPYDHPPGADVASLLYPEPYFASPPDSTQAASSPKPALVCRSKKDADRASQANAVAMEPATTEELELPPQVRRLPLAFLLERHERLFPKPTLTCAFLTSVSPQQPLIGPKISSEEITVEYAKANTIFITKTTVSWGSPGVDRKCRETSCVIEFSPMLTTPPLGASPYMANVQASAR